MTTLRGENGTCVGYTLSDCIHQYTLDAYIIEMPTLICNKEKDAKYMQQELNKFIGKLSRKIVDEQ